MQLMSQVEKLKWATKTSSPQSVTCISKLFTIRAAPLKGIERKPTNISFIYSGYSNFYSLFFIYAFNIKFIGYLMKGENREIYWNWEMYVIKDLESLSYLFWMVNDTCDFLGMALKNTDNLSRIFIKHCHILIITSCDYLWSISETHI